jgi:hypothetical protein
MQYQTKNVMTIIFSVVRKPRENPNHLLAAELTSSCRSKIGDSSKTDAGKRYYTFLF